MELDFLIVASGLNCAGNVYKCYESILNQTYTNYNAILISDGSTDATAQRLDTIKFGNVTTQSFKDNVGACKRRYDAIKGSCATSETVILLLGLDDYLLPNALEVIKEQYDEGKLMTYGNWIDQKGRGLPLNFPFYFDELTHKNRDYRKVTYRSTAPNTFKKYLYDNIPEEEFLMNDGRWFDTTTESHLMFSCLEMCGKDRIGVITVPIYVYNRDLPNGTLRRLGGNYKRQVLNQVINRPKYDLI